MLLFCRLSKFSTKPISLFRLMQCFVVLHQVGTRSLKPALGRAGLLHQDFITGKTLGLRVLITSLDSKRVPQPHMCNSCIEVAGRKRIGINLNRFAEEPL